jgi:hypothetical protein
MAEPKEISRATLFALLLVAAAYIVTGVGLLLLYPNIQTDVLSLIPTEGILPTLTRLAMVVVVIATAPLLIVPCGELLEGKINPSQTNKRLVQIIVRFSICFLTVAISVEVPGFVNVLTFVGCFCVAFVSFCIPPFLYLVLLLGEGKTPIKGLWVDVLMLAWGLVATVISTTYVFRRVEIPQL